jgi:uncharacterized protein
VRGGRHGKERDARRDALRQPTRRPKRAAPTRSAGPCLHPVLYIHLALHLNRAFQYNIDLPAAARISLLQRSLPPVRMLPAANDAGPDPAGEASAAAVAKALAAAAARGDAAALAGLLPPLAPSPPQAALDAALLAAAGAGTPLDGCDAAAALLLGAGAAVYASDGNGATPLHLAAASGNVRLIRRLLAAGACVHFVACFSSPHSGGMPHHLAASRGRCEVLALLLDSEAQVRPLSAGADGEGAHAGWQEWWLAACSRPSICCASLALAPRQIEAMDGDGKTALHLAAGACDADDDNAGEAAAAATELLLQRGARVDARDIEGAVPLHDAARRRHLEVMRLLLDHGAEVDAQDHDAWTPLSALFEDSQPFAGLSAAGAVELLASRGADANALDLRRHSPLDHACWRPDTDADTVRALLAAGARIQLGSGPWLIDALLDAAADAGVPPNVGAIDALIDAGAGASLRNALALAEAAAGFVDAADPEEAEALVRAVPRVLAAAERALDEGEGARGAARLAASVEADRRDVASGLRTLMVDTAAERRRLEAARAALAQERRAAAAEREAAARERQAAEMVLAQLQRRRTPTWSWPRRLLSMLGVAQPSEAPDSSGGGDTEPPTKRARRG